MSHIDELQAPLDKWKAEEKAEDKPIIEPCPICGEKMRCITGSRRIGHVDMPCDYYFGASSIDGHNIIARALREAKKQVTMFPNGTTVQLKAVVIDLLKLQAKAREEMKWATSNIKEAKEGM